MFLYENGVVVKSRTQNFILNDSSPLRIGAGASESDGGNYFYSGRLQDFRYYNRVLTQTEITNIYSTGKTIVNPTIPYGPSYTETKMNEGSIMKSEQSVPNVGYLPSFKEETDLMTNLKLIALFFDPNCPTQDLMGNATVTLYNSPTIDYDGINFTRSSSQYLSLGDTYIGGTLTFGLWLKNHDREGGYQRILDFTTSSNTERISLMTYNTLTRFLKEIWRSRTKETSSQINTPTDTVEDYKWVHFVWVMNQEAGKITLYVNGAESSSGTTTKFANLATRQRSYLGADTNGASNFDGQIKSFYLWERALDESEISTLYSYGCSYNIKGSAATTKRGRPIPLYIPQFVGSASSTATHLAWKNGSANFSPDYRTFTVSFWINLQVHTGIIIGNYHASGTGRGWRVAMNSQGLMYFTIYHGTSNSDNVTYYFGINFQCHLTLGHTLCLLLILIMELCEVTKMVLMLEDILECLLHF